MPTCDPIDLVSSSDEDDEGTARTSSSLKRKIHSIHETEDTTTSTSTSTSTSYTSRNQMHEHIDKIRTDTTDIDTTSTSAFITSNLKKQKHDDGACDSLGNFFHQLSPNDNGTLSRVKLPFSTDSNVLTCSRCPPILACSCDQRIAAKTLHVAHIQQDDKWSCGFRNAQMILYSVLSDLPSDHLLLRDEGSNTIPSIEQLQKIMEDAWKEGFDPTGCKHFKGKLIGKHSKVGAMEIASVLSFLHFDCAVVQFIVCDESRSLLGPFVWEYFQRRNGCQFCKICRTEPAFSVSLAQDLLEWIGKDPNYANETCHHPVQPLYLQWEGHSVTIVGIERCESTYNLIVFDPMRRWISTHEHELTWFQHIRLSTQVTQRKDCQIVLCNSVHINETEWQKRKSNETCHVVTAAHDIVQKRL